MHCLHTLILQNISADLAFFSSVCTQTLNNSLRLRVLTGGPSSPFSPLDPASMENCVGGTSQLWKPSVAGGVTGLYEGLVGRGVAGDLVVMACFVGLVVTLETGLEVLAVVVLGTVGFEGLILDFVGSEGTALTEFDLGLDGVALDDVTLGLGGVLLAVVGCGFFGTVP